MLSLLSPVEAAAQARALTRTGTPLMWACVTDPGVRSSETATGRPAAAAVVFVRPRPQASTSSALFAKNAIGAAGQAVFARPQLPSQNQPNLSQHIEIKSSQKYAHTTRIAAAGGGAKGPHPARDPV
jgi:hypothetical protein